MRQVVINSLISTLVFLILNIAFRLYEGESDAIEQALTATLIFLLVYGGIQLVLHLMKKRRS